MHSASAYLRHRTCGAGLNETTMSNTNNNSKLDHREVTDTELDAVNGGQREPTYHPAKVTVPDLKLS
jgi:hypothetical protein